MISFVTLKRYISCFFLLKIVSDPNIDYDSKTDFPFYLVLDMNAQLQIHSNYLIVSHDVVTLRACFKKGHRAAILNKLCLSYSYTYRSSYLDTKRYRRYCIRNLTAPGLRKIQYDFTFFCAFIQVSFNFFDAAALVHFHYGCLFLRL